MLMSIRPSVGTPLFAMVTILTTFMTDIYTILTMAM